jgi:Zn-dependent metalloprotease
MKGRIGFLLLLATLFSTGFALTVGAQSVPASKPAQQKKSASDPSAVLCQLQRSQKSLAPLDPLKIIRTPSGHVRSLSASPKAPLRVSDNAADPAQTAQAFVRKYQGAFTSAGSLNEFQPSRVHSKAGRSYIRLNQTYGGIPVWAGEMTVQVNRGAVEFVLSDVMTHSASIDTGRLALSPTLTAQEARTAAVQALQAEYPQALLAAAEPQLLIYDPALVGNSGEVQLVWKTIVTAASGPRPREFVLVNAHSGAIPVRYSLLYDLKDRTIYDRNNVPGDLDGILVRSEGTSATGISDADLAYDCFGSVYDFYFDHHTRDSIDNGGMTLSATVRFVPEGETAPYDNAYWDDVSKRMYFGDGIVSDDIVGHELTHGVTDYESGLIYQNQSGAINESLSDMWGEWIDLTNSIGNDSPNVRWQMGEDVITTLTVGPFRDMKNPPAYDCPDTMSSSYYYNGTIDSGGVHTNSGVGNKLCYLLTDGDTFNGYTITGFGIDKAAQLFYECQTNLLNSGSDYEDLYFTLLTAAGNLNFSQADIDNIENACAAVEIKTIYNIAAQYEVTYKDRYDQTLQPTINSDGQIILDDPNAVGTLKIKKRKGVSSYRAIREVRVAGSLTTLSTQGDIAHLNVARDIGTISTDKAYIEEVVVGGNLTSVKMTDLARSSSTYGGEIFYTSIFANQNSPAVRAASGLPKLSVNLSGVSLIEFSAPDQTVSIKLASKKWTNPSGDKDVSLSYIPYAEDNYIWAKELTQLSCSGGGPWYLTSDSLDGPAIMPYKIFAQNPTKTCSITGTGVLFTVTENDSTYKEFYSGSLFPDYVEVQGPALSIQITGGNILGAGYSVDGEITKLQSKFARYRLGKYFHYIGGQTGYLYDGYNTLFASGMWASMPDKDIWLAYGDIGIQGDFMAGAELDNGYIYPNYGGAIRQLATRKPNNLYPENPKILGEGWSKEYIKFVGGDHSSFVEHNP